jgi:hypothetical protein
MAPEQKPSIYAAEGTAAHEISERALRGNKDCSQFLGETLEIDGFDIEITEEIVDSAQTYVDYVVSQNDEAAGALLFIEERYTLDQLQPPFEAGGTCDAVIINPKLRLLEVVDLKHGRGIVDVNGNKQTRTYALMALLNAPKQLADSIDYIKVTIVQPRAYHKDGRIRSEIFHLADLIEWTGDLMKAMGRAQTALDAFEKINGSRTLFDEWAEKALTTRQLHVLSRRGSLPEAEKRLLRSPLMSQNNGLKTQLWRLFR